MGIEYEYMVTLDLITQLEIGYHYKLSTLLYYSSCKAWFNVQWRHLKQVMGFEDISWGLSLQHVLKFITKSGVWSMGG